MLFENQNSTLIIAEYEDMKKILKVAFPIYPTIIENLNFYESSDLFSMFRNIHDTFLKSEQSVVFRLPPNLADSIDILSLKEADVGHDVSGLHQIVDAIMAMKFQDAECKVNIIKNRMGTTGHYKYFEETKDWEFCSDSCCKF